MSDVKTITHPNGVKIEFNPGNHRYKINGESGWPSVTTILGIIDKPQLIWWAQKVGLHGAAQLAKLGVPLGEFAPEEPIDVDGMDYDELLRLMKQHGLRTNDLRDARGDEGTIQHAVAEEFGKTGKAPSLKDFEPNVRPRIQGFCAFLVDATPKFIETEVIVAHREHRYAGMYDARAALPSCSLVVNAETGERADFPLGRYMIDYKSGKRIYDEASLQLAGYEGASIDCGYHPTDEQIVVRVTDDGKYEVARCWSKPETFYDLAGTHRSLKEDGKRKTELEKSTAAQAAETAVAA